MASACASACANAWPVRRLNAANRLGGEDGGWRRGSWLKRRAVPLAEMQVFASLALCPLPSRPVGYCGLASLTLFAPRQQTWRPRRNSCRTLAPTPRRLAAQN